MVKRDNEFTRAMFEILDEFRTLHEEANKANPVPFGQRRVRRSELRGELEGMTAEQRRQMLADPGQRNRILDMLRNSDAV